MSEKDPADLQEYKCESVADLLHRTKEEFVDACYISLLGRPPDPEGRRHYNNVLEIYGRTRVIEDIANNRSEPVRLIAGLPLNHRKRLFRLFRKTFRASEKDTGALINNDAYGISSISSEDLGKAANLSRLENRSREKDPPPAPAERELEDDAKGNLPLNYGSKLTLAPRSGIHPHNLYQYRAIDSDPQLVTINHPPLPPGWYKITAELVFAEDFSLLQIYTAPTEFDSITYPIISGSKSSILIKINCQTPFLRVDPADRECRFSVINFVLDRLENEPTAEDFETSLLGVSQVFATSSNRGGDHIRSTPVTDGKYFELIRAASDYMRNQLNYLRWIKRIETPWREKRAQSFPKPVTSACSAPVFSVVMAVYNPPKNFLVAAIDSVLQQTFPNFELCIADDCSTLPHVRETLDYYSKLDKRIRVEYRATNGHIANATNSAIEIAGGRFIVFMDHDDLLDEHALACHWEEYLKNPNIALVYSDEDFIDENDNRRDPHFKSDWNPDLLLTHNYITHLVSVDREQIGNELYLDPECDWAQDYDFLLRVTSKLQPTQVSHVPQILYHWRAHAGSTALQATTKPYADLAGATALRKHCERNTICASVDRLGGNFYRVTRTIEGEQTPFVSIIIPNKDQKEVLARCIESIIKVTKYKNFEIVLVENNSCEKETFAYYKEVVNRYNQVKVLYSALDFNWSRLNNFGATLSKGEVFLFLNNDVEITHGEWLTEMVSHAIRPEIGCVGSLLLYPDLRIQHAGIILGIGGLAGHSHKHASFHAQGYFRRIWAAQNLSAVTGACLAIKSKIFHQAGGFSEDFTVAFNDVDFCLKVRDLGYFNLYTPHAILIHHESVSRGYEDNPSKLLRFHHEAQRLRSKWGQALDADPFYSPHLTRDREDFSLISP